MPRQADDLYGGSPRRNRSHNRDRNRDQTGQGGFEDGSPCEQCPGLARIVNGAPMCFDGNCLVEFLRNDFTVEILGRPTGSPLVFAGFLSFEVPDANGRMLCLGETPLLQDEVNSFISVLRERGIDVTALHNHWLFERPRVMFLHFEAIMRPASFAQAVAEAFRVIGVRPVPPPT